MSSPKPSVAAKTRAKAAAKPAAASGATAASAGDLTGDAVSLAAAIEGALAQGNADALTGEAVQRLMAAVCRAYRAQIDAGANYLPLAGKTAVAPTDSGNAIELPSP